MIVPMDLTSRLRAVLERDDHVIAAYLFGSRARGGARAGSDVDIAVLLDPPPAASLSGIPETLRGELGLAAEAEADVDLIVLNNAPPDLVHRVLRDGQLVIDRNRSRRIAFEVRARNEYFDLLPVLEEYRRGPRRTS
jgi:predicted nucleotidyltransferase